MPSTSGRISFWFTQMLNIFAGITDQDGQDLVEYSLLLGAIALAGAASIIGMGGTLDTLWTIINNHVTNASN